MRYSIIVPCYNCARFIRQTLDSVVSQESQDWEIICVDDGSTDETGSVLDQYVKDRCKAVEEHEQVINAIGDEEKHPGVAKRVLIGEFDTSARITVVHQRNCGVSGARNTAITIATGDWLICLDGDDLLTTSALQIVDACIGMAPDSDIIGCGFRQIGEEESKVDSSVFDDIRSIDISKVYPSAEMYGCFQRFIFKRSVVGDIAYKWRSCSEEMPYVTKCFVRAQKLTLTSAYFYGYRIIQGSMSHRALQLCNFIDYYDSLRCVAEVLFESRKTISRTQARGMINRWLEDRVYRICELKAVDQEQAWEYWFEHLDEIIKYKSLCSKWQWFVVLACMSMKSRHVPMVLCYFPHWLKLKGLHR